MGFIANPGAFSFANLGAFSLMCVDFQRLIFKGKFTKSNTFLYCINNFMYFFLTFRECSKYDW